MLQRFLRPLCGFDTRRPRPAPNHAWTDTSLGSVGNGPYLYSNSMRRLPMLNVEHRHRPLNGRLLLVPHRDRKKRCKLKIYLLLSFSLRFIIESSPVPCKPKSIKYFVVSMFEDILSSHSRKIHDLFLILL